MDDDATLYRSWLSARDEQAFTVLARRHASLVADVALRAGGDRGAAEDALQEALLALALDGTKRPVEVGLRPWLARAALTRALHRRSSEQARARRERQVATAAQRAEPPMQSGAAELRETVYAALARLDGEVPARLPCDSSTDSATASCRSRST